jgi:hypothetical protein
LFVLHQEINGLINPPVMKQLFKQFYLSILLTFCIYPVLGSHIIGGNMTYKCLGNYRYEITLQLYRDCNCSNCADFDTHVNIGVYRCGNLINCNNLSQTSFLTLDFSPLISRTTVLNPDIPGFQFPEQCLERGDYKFIVTLPISFENYFIAYQRCCRPETLSNIPDSQNTGMTIFTEIKSNAVIACNNGLIFTESIHPVFCLNNTFEIDHSANDTDGDSLVYSICSAFKGAGLEGGPEMPNVSSSGCDGIIPSPACPPPYEFVDYASGFTGIIPLGIGSQLSIDPQTGLITVNPSIAGQFLVTICVNEFRNGILINNSYREFTYLAAECQTTFTNEKTLDKSLKLFPNPASNFIQINLENPGASSNQIQIFNSYGLCKEKLDWFSNDQKIDISGWPAGLYKLILLEDGKIARSEKFVKIEN